MKRLVFLLYLAICSAASLPAQSTALYDDSKIASIYLDLPAATFNHIVNDLVNDQYSQARFIFDDGQHRDTIAQVGLRLRGNTSLSAAKKSFKISFNAFVPGREYQGVRKLNLNGSHNDPTMIREKLFYEVWQKAGMPERRTSFVKLYVNQQYRGLYTNIEEIDKQWLTRAYGDNEGNLYKCTYPADLGYLGLNPQSYKSILHDPVTRAYELSTNETADDYSRLVALITALNQPVNASSANQISQILNVNAVLKAFALDVATGNWDDYFYNKNNYYIYDNPATGRFEFITYDTDNTFGVDWLGKDWAKRNALAWQHATESRPLATKLLAVPAFRDQYIHYLDSITRFITLPQAIFPRIEVLHGILIPAAATDPFRPLDYGYDMTDFHNGFSTTVDGHTPYGIKPFLLQRHDSTLSQIAGLLTAINMPDETRFSIQIYPNPVNDHLWIRTAPEYAGQLINGTLYDGMGRLIETKTWRSAEDAFSWPLTGLAQGWYVLRAGAETRRIWKGK